MNLLVEKIIRENFGIILLNSKPVNALSIELRKELNEALQEFEHDEVISTIIISAKGKIFSAGADINEFKTSMAQPDLNEIISTIEKSKKTTIMAFNGSAFGGGFELGLACHYRLAIEGASFGLPEINLGIIPGAGGTQKLPRLVGVENSINIICYGKQISAKKAIEIGTIDKIINFENDFLEKIISWAKENIKGEKVLRPFEIKNDDLILNDDYKNSLLQDLKKKFRAQISPFKALEAIEASIKLPFKEGMKKEAEIFHECNKSSQAKALQHLFFSEREAKEIKSFDKNINSRKVEKVAIIGAGLMGIGIAINFLTAKIPTIIMDLNPASLDKAIKYIKNHFDNNVQKGRISIDEAKNAYEMLAIAHSYEEISNADLIIEAVFENLEVKKEVFSQLSKYAKKNAILASNTSTLDINLIAKATNRPQDVLGLHFFSPANIMRLVEIVNAKNTAPDALKTAMDICIKIKKIGIVVGVCYGFVGNRMLEPYFREAHRLLLEGASVEQIDKAISKFGFAMGPFTMNDMAGIDIGAKMRKENRENISHDPSYCIIGDELAKNGHFGQKTGKGFYIYQGKDKLLNPEIEIMANEFANILSIKRRQIEDTEIIERMIFPLINEGLKVLEENIAQRASDIDIIWCNGYGFSPLLGGPIHWASEYGFHNIFKAYEKYKTNLGEYGNIWFTPSELLEKISNNKIDIYKI